MIRVTVEGPGREKVGKDLKHFFQTGQRKVVKHFTIAPDDWSIVDLVGVDVVIVEVKEKTGGQ